MRNLAAGESASARYLERLKEIAEKNPASAFSSLADYLRARELKNQGDLVQAYALADRGRKAHPASLGGRNCDALISDIASRDFDVRNERVVSPGTSSVLDVRYRNLTALHFRAVRDDFEARLAAENAGDLFWPGDEPVRELLEREPAAAWSADLPATADFQARAERVAAPALPPGFYRLLVSADPAFSRGKNKIQAGSFWVSEWGIVTAGAGRALEGFVVRGVTGDPVSGASVSLYDWDYGTDRLVKRGEGRTDDAGAFALAAPESYSNRLLVARGEKGIEVVETQVLTGSGRPASYERERTVFFTDRSLYRPGQTIHFKGLCLKADENRADYRILPRRNVRWFSGTPMPRKPPSCSHDQRFRVVQRNLHRPGRPPDGDDDDFDRESPGILPHRVEEYKRPKFRENRRSGQGVPSE